MRTFNKQLASALALDANRNSDFAILKNIYTYSVSFIVTGTPTGTVKLQASNDPDTNETQYNATSSSPPSVAPVNWADIANSSFTLSASGETLWNVNAVGYNFVRVVYTDASGGTSAATAKIVLNGKGS